MLNRSKLMIAALTAVSLAAAGWMVGDMTARADSLPLAGAPLVCAKGFKAEGSNDGYSCTSEKFKCNAGMSLLTKQILGNRATYSCGYPEG